MESYLGPSPMRSALVFVSARGRAATSTPRGLTCPHLAAPLARRPAGTGRITRRGCMGGRCRAGPFIPGEAERVIKIVGSALFSIARRSFVKGRSRPIHDCHEKKSYAKMLMSTDVGDYSNAVIFPNWSLRRFFFCRL